MKNPSYKTQSIRKEDVERSWYVIDGTNQTVGRMCTEIARVLRGKHKASFTPHIDNGDYVIVTNCEKVRFTGNKMAKKEYVRYSGYPGGQKRATPADLMARFPERIVENAVRGMLPKNRLGRAIYKKLFVYAGDAHPHSAQKPQVLEISK